jgi:Mn2+/Fe2+ NRAMP family transporter
VVILLADIGATITPWMLYFQQGAVSDKGLLIRDIHHGRLDTAIGAVLATVSALAAIIATDPLYVHHMNPQQFGAAQFAQALVPYVGRIGAALFAVGILEAGLVAVIIISTSSAYAFGEVTRFAHSLNRPLRSAREFYGLLLAVAVMSGMVVLLPGFPLEQVVIIVNVIAVLTMPPAIGFLLILANDTETVGQYKNTKLLNVLGIGVGVFVSVAGILYALTVILPGLRL